MNPEITKINTLKAHLAINVRDVENSIEFYKQMLGIEPSKVRTGYAKFDVQNPPLNLTLNQVAFNERGALSHLGIQVASTDDVLAQRQIWAERGLITRDEMQTDCCYATQDKTWVKDPDGNEWEVFVVLKDNLPEGTQHGDSTCCVVTESSESTEGAACGCTSKAPADGEAACCETQAQAFGIEVNPAAEACCATAA
ncbi:MAG TPA: ArsI/CadI family heavy metal resistance metalloenzyme [Pyrinomonadaceae bacterium]